MLLSYALCLRLVFLCLTLGTPSLECYCVANVCVVVDLVGVLDTILGFNVCFIPSIGSGDLQTWGQLSSFSVLLARSMVCCLGFSSLLYADMFLIDSNMLPRHVLRSLVLFWVTLSPVGYPISNNNKDQPRISQ